MSGLLCIVQSVCLTALTIFLYWSGHNAVALFVCIFTVVDLVGTTLRRSRAEPTPREAMSRLRIWFRNIQEPA